MFSIQSEALSCGRSSSRWSLCLLSALVILTMNRCSEGVILSQARQSLVATSVADLAIFAGGYTNTDGAATAQVDIFNITSNTWTTATLSVARGQLAATSIADLAVFAGGSNYTFPALSAVDVFNATSKLWTTTSLSAPRCCLAAASAGTVALFVGGIGSSVVDIFNTTSNIWTSTTISISGYDLAATSVGELALFWSGLSQVNVYNSTSETWSTIDVPLAGFSSSVATSVSNLALFAALGSDGGEQILIYDVVSNSWSNVSSTHSYQQGAATTVGDIVIFTGDENSAVTTIYNSTSNTWSNSTLIIQQRYYMAATSVGNLAIFAGGISMTGVSAEIDIYDLTTQTWSPTCPPGTEVHSTSYVTCVNCSVGTFTGSSNSHACMPCPGGTYANQNGSSECSSCLPGTFSPSNSSFCLGCPAGMYAPSVNTSTCATCPAGNYSTGNASTCPPCPAGTASSTEGAQSEGDCSVCGAGTYAPEGATACLRCPNDTTSESGSSVCSESSSQASPDMQSILIGVILGAVVLLLCGVLLVVFWRRKRTPTVFNERSDGAIPMTTVRSKSLDVTTQYSSIADADMGSSYQSISPPQQFTHSTAKLPADRSVIPFEELIIGKELGAGVSGTVYAGKWRGTQVAIKDLGSNISESEREQFFSEAEIMKNLRPHNNVIQFFGLSSSHSRPLLVVMALCEGGSLYSLLHSDKQLRKEEWERIIRGTTAGMLHLHRENIVHRDLAARNILLGPNYEPKVTDFGLSRSVDQGEGTTYSNVGPLKHMAPECILHLKYSFKSDVWAYAVTLWEIFERKEPYPGLRPIQVSAQVVQAEKPLRLTPPASMSSQFAHLFRRCLATNPMERPSFDELSAELDKIDSPFQN